MMWALSQTSGWTTAGLTKVYHRENIIRAFVEGIGHDDKNDHDEDFLKHAMDDLPNETADMLRTARLVDVESDEDSEDE